VDGHTIAPGYEYDAAKADMVKRLGIEPENFFPHAQAHHQEVREDRGMGPPVPDSRHAGVSRIPRWQARPHLQRVGDPTRNVRGWKGPCYLMTDGHYKTYNELIEKTNWDKIGVVNGEARDPRCENCMMNCGYEPTRPSA